jgi:hypothetical protein
MAEYRFLGVAQSGEARAGAARFLPRDGSEPDALSHSVLIGLRYAFGSTTGPASRR